MMKAMIIRNPSTDEGTFGVLEFGGDKVFTTELPWRENRQKVSCIPPGVYDCEIVKSPAFGRVYEVKKVPGRSHVLIHSANFAGDESLGYTTELQGCIAPSMRRGKMVNKAGLLQMAGLVSRPALNAFMKWAAGKPFKLEIKS